VVFDHVKERIENSRCERNCGPIQSPQQAFRGIDLEVAELVEVSRGSLHRHFQNNSEKFSRSLKTFIEVPGIFRHAQIRLKPHLRITEQNPQKTVNQKLHERTRK
jgi:hypothetical protein